ncbi:MAG: FlgD immunoglobulin-like domain containing protein, partial [Candidatus Edwardsbacteria bacterium]|nr:FlgD immunoglobulin-like domain containing protein [Candidatus Edwardsbacteria bacterium]
QSARGTLQDWSYHVNSFVDVTIELDNVKWPNQSQLPTFWNENRASMLYFIRQAGWGVQGVVTDSITGLPINRAQVAVGGINKPVYADSLAGDYHRMLMTGNYNLTFSKTGYASKTINNIRVKFDSVTNLNVQLAPVTGVAALPLERPLPVITELFYSRPNPITDRTFISYQLRAPGRVSLKIYNVAGQLVRTLANGYQNAGYHSVLWNGNDNRGERAASGMYLYRLDAGSYSATNKLVIIR